jgi:Ca-activated chloride channel family protein
MTPPDSLPEEGSAEAVEDFDQLGASPMSDMEPGEQMSAASALGGLPMAGPGMGIIEQRLQQVEGDPSLLIRNQFMLEEMQQMQNAGGPLRESRPW